MKKKELNKLFAYSIQNLAKDVEINNELKSQELKQNKEIEEKKLAVKDRVDLSLKEYNEMVGKIESLEASNKFYKTVFDDLKINSFLPMADLSTIKVKVIEDDFNLKPKVCISFYIEPLI